MGNAVASRFIRHDLPRLMPVATDQMLNQAPEKPLRGESSIALVGVANDELVGGLVAYKLTKFEQERSGIYIYDLVVKLSHRRQRIATALTAKLEKMTSKRGTYVFFVQADTDLEDKAAIALYSKFGKREDVMRFDIGVEDGQENVPMNSSTDLPTDVVEAIQAGRKIDAIKLLREAKELGLKEAKHEVDAYLLLHPSVRQPRSNGTGLVFIVVVVVLLGYGAYQLLK
jgi:ribosomal protein L7/L12